MSAPLALASAPAMQPAMLRSTPPRVPRQPFKFTQGPLKVLQSSRAPAQLSLFGRPHNGR